MIDARNRVIASNTGTYVEGRVRTGTIADRRDAGTMARKRWTRILNITFVVSVSLALVGPAILSSYFGVSVHTITSGSMQPAINPGDMLISKVKIVNQIQLGEVVMLTNLDSWDMQAHRVISKKDDGDSTILQTKGDTNNDPDRTYTIGTSSPIRAALFTVPKFGYVLTALSTGTAKLIGGILILLVNFIIISNVLVKRRKGDKREPLFHKSELPEPEMMHNEENHVR
jgi:signal peptidase